jgi:hypothetical protein
MGQWSVRLLEEVAFKWKLENEWGVSGRLDNDEGECAPGPSMGDGLTWLRICKCNI